jgi:hypothetical protein
MSVTTAEIGDMALIQQTEDGRICQIAMNKKQHQLLQMFLVELSRSGELIRMPDEYDLQLKNK